MPQHEPAWYIGFGMGVVFGALFVGALLGLVPLLVGRRLSQPKLGLTGLAACVLGNLVGGLLVSVPLAVGFSATAWWRSKAQRRSIAVVSSQDDA